MKNTVVSKYVLGALLGAAVVGGTALELERPAKLSSADLGGAIFKSPQVRKVTEGGATALEVDTLTSADKKFQTGAYQAGPEHLDIKDGYPEYEFFYVLKGSIKLTDAKGAQVIGPGEAVSIPKGWKGHWDSDGYTKVWVTYDPK
ncbi:MAG TPA: cupin domain-containing protein [Steroidobacteraceae bacterium]|nr:cupin domain-containing protein [Steroidobacteraceae bacterium]